MTKITNQNGVFEIFDTIDKFAERYEPAGRWAMARQWSGNMSGAECLRAAREGHQPSVELSEAYLAKFEDMAFVSRKTSTVDAVAGGAPNIGAYLAGSPLSMRRRQRQMQDFAPMTIFCDVVSSAGIGTDYLKKRGAAVLALARMLSATRPVTIYAVGGMGASFKSYANGFVLTKMPETVDLARMAFMMAHPAASRGMLYTVAALVNPSVRGNWAFGNVDTYRSKALAMYAEVVGSDVNDCLYVAPPFFGEQDQQIEQWVKDMLAKYGAAAE